MSRISPRINELLSLLDDQNKKLIRIPMNLNYNTMSVMLIKQYAPFKPMQINDNEIAELLMIVQKPQIQMPQDQNKFHILKKKADRILMKQYALKNIDIFKHRENLGPKGQMYMDIGNELNELGLSSVDWSDIKSNTKKLWDISTEINKCDIAVNK
eukprot:UN04402